MTMDKNAEVCRGCRQGRQPQERVQRRRLTGVNIIRGIQYNKPTVTHGSAYGPNVGAKFPNATLLESWAKFASYSISTWSARRTPSLSRECSSKRTTSAT